jgi:hypothetical protein
LSRNSLRYEQGQGVPQDYAEAVKWYRLAAAQGDAKAQFNLGLAYEHGQGVEQDNAEAVKLFRLAAAQGDARAQRDLGTMYELGKGVTQDYVRSHMWFNLSAASGWGGGIDLFSVMEQRDLVAAKMTPQQIAEAQKMASECQQRHFRDCH